jgi:hypothetical protein
MTDPLWELIKNCVTELAEAISIFGARSVEKDSDSESPGYGGAQDTFNVGSASAFVGKCRELWYSA